MPEIAIVSDSTTCLPEELIKKYKIHVIPTWIQRGTESFRDGVDITCQQVYKWLREGHRLGTSQPAVGEFIRLFNTLAKRAEGIISVVLTGDLSGTYNSAVTAARTMEGFPIQVIDSRSTSMAQGFLVLAAARALEAGATLSQAVEKAKALIPKMNLLAIIDDLQYAARGGRLPAIAAAVGSLFRITPILDVKDGRVNILAQVRSKRKAVERALMEMKARVGEAPVHVAIVHADAQQEAEKLKERVTNLFQTIELYLTELPPVLGVHAGPGTLGLAFYKD